jgi:hypothetical protein
MRMRMMMIMIMIVIMMRILQAATAVLRRSLFHLQRAMVDRKILS